MKWLHVFLAFVFGLLFYLSYNLWFDDNEGLPAIDTLEARIQQVNAENAKLEERNNTLEVTISSLKNDINSQEEVARYKLGFIQEDETFYQILPDEEGPQHEE